MDFGYDDTTTSLIERLEAFMEEFVYPAEATFFQQRLDAADRWSQVPLVEELKQEARARGLWNLCNASAPADQLDDLVADFVEPLADKSPFCMKITKNTVNRGLDADQESLIVMEQMACNVVHHSNDAKEGVAAFLEKRDPVWTGT